MSLTVESRASQPGGESVAEGRGAGETPGGPSNFSSGIDRGQSLFDALLKRLVSVDRSFGVGDGFEAGFHFKVEREGSVARRVRGIGFEVEMATSGFLGTGALDDRPGLSEFASELENAVDLVAAGKGAAVQKDFTSRSILQQEAGGFEHDLHHEVVLLDGIFDIFWREQGGAELIFAEECALSAVGQFAGERSFPCAGKTCHQDDHAVESVAEAESSSTFSLRPSSR